MMRCRMHTQPYKVMNELPILVLLKFTRFLPRIKAKTLSSICNVPRDNDKYRKSFPFIIWGIADYGCGYMKEVGPIKEPT